MKQLAQKQVSSTMPIMTRAQAGTKLFTDTVTGLSRILDKIAGLCMGAIMLLIISNILLRALFNHPILGTYEYAGFLTAAAIGLALAYCAIQNGHIAVSFVVDRFPPGIQAAVDIFSHMAALCFWGLAAWHTLKYGTNMASTGLVSPTTQTPVYPFVYIVSFGIFILCLVELVRLIESIKKAAFNK